MIHTAGYTQSKSKAGPVLPVAVLMVATGSRSQGTFMVEAVIGARSCRVYIRRTNEAAFACFTPNFVVV